MKNKNNRTKKWLIAAGGLVICVVLVAAISSQFEKEKPADAPIPSQSAEISDVTVDNENTEKETEKEVIVTKPDITEPESNVNGAVSTGTEQTIQGDVEKPKEPEPPKTEDGKDRTPPKTESGKNHEFTPESPDAPPTYKPEETEKKPAESKPSGGLPGFDNVPDGGANTVIEVDGDGDINKQVGTMD